MIKTMDEYWDCECDTQYIHKKSDRTECPRCHAKEDEMPDSRLEEFHPKNMFFEESMNLEREK